MYKDDTKEQQSAKVQGSFTTNHLHQFTMTICELYMYIILFPDKDLI